MTKIVWIFILVSLLLSLTFVRNAGSETPPLAAPSGEIALHEAEILIYLLPQAQELRSQGMDIGWELQTSPKLKQKDFYSFWVVNSKRPNVQGSVTVGYFSVNKHTAEVWSNDKEKTVSSAELEGVEKILRMAHHIDDATLRKFGSLHP